ncbi:hypothetical protein CCR75_007577 [Bremia lactucae]|uniref:Uncharacterized protein n=1 Tax=Bremia lactucae TaxID=4779 RepID=A0A976FJS1_BRELC|nr:hypothetical protein CCR75_007577 [Bremia lactucae]
MLTQSRYPGTVDRIEKVARFLRSHSMDEAEEERLSIWTSFKELLFGGPFSPTRLRAMTADNAVVQFTFSAWNKFSHDDIRKLLAEGMKDMDKQEKEKLNSIIELYFMIRGPD